MCSFIVNMFWMISCNCTCDIYQFLHMLEQIWQKLYKTGITINNINLLSINFSYGTFVLILYCTPICLVKSSCLTKSTSSSSNLRTLSISLFSICFTFPSTSIILVRGPLGYPLFLGIFASQKWNRLYTNNPKIECAT